MSTENEVKLKKSVVFRNKLPEIESMVNQGYTLEQIAEKINFKITTFKKYYYKFRGSATVSSNTNEKFSHAKNNDANINEENVNFENALSESNLSFTDALDPNKRSENVQHYMQQRKPLGKGNK